MNRTRPHPALPPRPVVAALAAVSSLLLAVHARAERLPITRFTTEQGLASDEVVCAAEGRHGFVWFGTGTGLSRFDGHGFRNFGAEAGVDFAVLSIAQDADGSLLLGAFNAAYRFDPAGGGRTTRLLSLVSTVVYPVRVVTDGRGAAWAGADTLYTLVRESGREQFRPSDEAPAELTHGVLALARDRRGSLWIGSRDVRAVLADGRRIRVAMPPHLGLVTSLAPTGRRVWVATQQGLCVVELDDVQSGPTCRTAPEWDAPVTRGARLAVGPGDAVWAGNDHGFLEVGPHGPVAGSVAGPARLPMLGGAPMLVDSSGNLWISAPDNGMARVALHGIVSFGREEGLAPTRIASLHRTPSGQLIVTASGHWLQRHGPGGFTSVRPNLPPATPDGWGWDQFEMQDRQGHWWIPTADGIFRFGAVRSLEDLARARPIARYTEADGLPSRDIFRLFEDARGDIWVGTLYHPPPFGKGKQPTLSRWERATGRFHQYGEAQGVTEDAIPTAFLEMPDGALWIAFSESGEVIRYRDGVFQPLSRLRRSWGDVRIHSVAMHRDAQGRVWVATRGAGVCRVDEPGASEPGCHHLTTRDGLSSDVVSDVTGDAQGRIYLATSHGVDVLEDDRVIWHLDKANGLPHRFVNVAAADGDGAIWFGTLDGLARLVPRPDALAAIPPRVLIDGLRVAGVPRPLSAAGESVIGDLTLAPDERKIQVDFLALSRNPGDPVRFQHRLSGEDHWSEATPERTLLLPHIAPGSYRLEVRAVGPSGTVSPEPAVVSFVVLAPVWQRGWFASLVAALLAGAAVAAYRLRVAHLLALERERMRIAMDLHDELGSGLGSIGVLADLAAGEEPAGSPRRDLLEKVASTASELGASMGDIVWSLRSGSGSVASLARHLSDRGRRMFPENGSVFQTRFPPVWPDVGLPLAVRHGIAMIGLEALHNAGRHSGASLVTLDLTPAGRRWRLTVSDNGRGIGDAQGGAGASAGGLGLESMRRRAKMIGAQLEVESRKGEGTTITVLFDPAGAGKTRVI